MWRGFSNFHIFKRYGRLQRNLPFFQPDVFSALLIPEETTSGVPLLNVFFLIFIEFSGSFRRTAKRSFLRIGEKPCQLCQPMNREHGKHLCRI
jgi:hypothetical protein